MLVYLIPPTIIVNLFAGTSILRDYIAISVHADRRKLICEFYSHLLASVLDITLVLKVEHLCGSRLASCLTAILSDDYQ